MKGLEPDFDLLGELIDAARDIAVESAFDDGATQIELRDALSLAKVSTLRLAAEQRAARKRKSRA